MKFIFKYAQPWIVAVCQTNANFISIDYSYHILNIQLQVKISHVRD